MTRNGAVVSPPPVAAPSPSAAISRQEALVAGAAAAELAVRLGVPVDDLQILRDGSNISVLLSPSMVVAKVANRRREIRPTAAWFAREVAVTRFLAGRNFAAVRPATCLPAGPHRHGDQVITFWELVPVSGPPVPPAAAGAALRGLHDELSGHRDENASFDPFGECGRVLDATPVSHFLSGERTFLRELAVEIFPAVRRWRGPTQALHGDPTPENILPTVAGPVWCDFEDTCTGSVLWDVACLLAPAEVAGDDAYCEHAAAGYGVATGEPAVRQFLAARVLHSAIWSAYVNTPGPSPRRLRRLAWLEKRR